MKRSFPLPPVVDVLRQLRNQGFAVIDGFVNEDDLVGLQDLFSKLTADRGTRVVNYSHDLVHTLSYDPFVLELSSAFFGEPSVPIQSLAFKYPTQQPIHQDTVHFSTYPQDLMMACWVALEDVSSLNGTLEYIPYSHLLPTFSKYDFPRGDAEQSYKAYESNLRLAVERLGLKVEKLDCKAGTAFVWHPRLWHGGSTPTNPSLTRFSYVTHYEASRSPVYLKHFGGLPLLPRLQSPKALATGQPLLRYGAFSMLRRFLRALR